MQPVIEVRNLSKQYGDFALRDVSFELPEGYVMGLIGPNGAGKTTIIKLLMNLIRSDGGSIRLFGKRHETDSVEIKSRIGFVYDNPNYYDHLNLKQFRNLIAPFYAGWDEKVFQDLVGRFGLPLRKRMSKFSRGMTMKAAIAVALSHRADLIIMDEPTSGLDPIFRRELLDLLYSVLQNEKKSILFSTHITSDLEKIADYLTFILDGELVFSDAKDSICERYGIVKGDPGLLTPENRSLFSGVRKTAFGFEGLTADIEAADRQLGSGVLIEKASLEEIMVLAASEGNDV